MVERQHLGNAPIKEALIDIRVTATASVDNLDSSYDQFSSDYPKREEIHRRTFGINISPTSDLASTVNQETLGIKYTSNDEKRVVQFRTDGFTFSWLEPYSDWTALRDEAKRIWLIYLSVSKSEAVSRIAVRYLNVMKIPKPIVDFAEYLAKPPEVPEGLPQGVSSFLTRMTIHEAKKSLNCAITQALESIQEDDITIILDIDAFKVLNYDPVDQKLWEDFEALHDFKNDVFFRSVTDKTLELFK